MYDDLLHSYAKNELPSIQLGGIAVDNQLLANSPVNLVLKSFTRHGLIAGATGSGKTKTIQVLCEQLSLAGIPSLVMDIKGDISGLAMPGEASDFLLKRSKSLDLAFNPRAFPVELLTLNNKTQAGLPLRATVSEFGPLLFSRMLDVNDTQAAVLTVLFEYAKTANLELIDLADLRALLHFVQTPQGKLEIEKKFGGMATASIGAIIRKIIELESQGGNEFFGEPGFNVNDLVRTTGEGLGIISILRLMDMQDKPKLFSTFMLKLLTDIYQQMPELGDTLKPKLVLFIDEAHVIFSNATKPLLNLLETMVKLIRSKGVGLIFCTQSPNDIPEAILGQLGLKIQHALRAFTAKDRKAMKLVAQNFPLTTYYNTEQLLTALGIGEALVTALDAAGQPTALIECLIRAPESRMGVLTAEELTTTLAHSTLIAKYQHRIERFSAQEKLEDRNAPMPNQSQRIKNTDPQTLVDKISKSTLFRQIIRQIIRDLTRTVMTALGIKRR